MNPRLTGDPASIRSFDSVAPDYGRASPSCVPVARLAAAPATLEVEALD